MKTFYILLLTLISQFAIAQNNFITRWDLATDGSGTTQLTFGVFTVGTVSYTWKEVSLGTASGSGTFVGTTATIAGLPSGAVIDLTIAPTNFARIYINNGIDKGRLTDVRQWGTTAWTSMEGAFYGCFNLQISATDLPNLSGTTSMASMFNSCTLLNGPANIGNWNTANVTDMNSMFRSASVFNQAVGTWNTAKVTDMGSMFFLAIAFNQPIGGWNTGSVTNMVRMFSDAGAFNQSIGNWNTSKVTNMTQMFYYAIAFNKSVGGWTLNAQANLGFIFLGSGLDCDHYSATLIGWSANAATPNGRSMEAYGSNYGTNAVAARNNLITTKGWTIIGDVASGTNCSAALPITLVSFSGKKTAENQNTLKWITADEKDFNRFEIQRSSDAKSFETIGSVLGQKVNDSGINAGTLNAYAFTDLTPGASNYYRLKMVDIDGSFDYSRIISINNSAEQAVVGSFYPNPSSGKVFVDVYAVESGSWTLTIIDASGKIIGTELYELQRGMNKIGMNRLSSGVNLVRFEHGLFSEVRKLVRE